MLPELSITVKGTPKDSLGNVKGQTQTSAALTVLMPEARQESHPLDFLRRQNRSTSDSFCATASQVEEFLVGIGLNLPGRQLAMRLNKELQALASRVIGIERNASENLERAREQVANVTARAEHTKSQLTYDRDGWRKYAEALEARIERSGGRISKQIRELRPLTEDVPSAD